MTGKILNIVKGNHGYDLIVLVSNENQCIYQYTVPTGTCDNYEGEYVSVNISVVKLANADYDHVYPEGTIGT